MTPVIKAENLTYIYGEKTSFEVAAIKNINIEIQKGDFVGIIGHTGSGKSTLIQHFNGLLKPNSGRVLLDGSDIQESKESVRAARFKAGLCFQYPEYQLFEDTVYKDIAFGPKNMGLGEDEISARVLRAARFVGINEELLSKSPFDLSGGEKRRAAIAGVMAMEPEVLMLDEPTAGLDPRGRDMILGLIKEYHEHTGSTVLLVSHSMEAVARLASKVLVLNNSAVAMFGTVSEVFSRGRELMEMDLNVPEITRIFIGLRDRGLPVAASVYTNEQGRDEILRVFGEVAP
ncbi:MAG: energy-coupling factor transporter ATPase [Clostridiales bacterium]|jgi:energy-coupling factor transport system ATP-binding protein|nr:energy-coupling factor transporter ATPase [Clostridiales bacterium]